MKLIVQFTPPPSMFSLCSAGKLDCLCRRLILRRSKLPKRVKRWTLIKASGTHCTVSFEGKMLEIFLEKAHLARVCEIMQNRDIVQVYNPELFINPLNIYATS